MQAWVPYKALVVALAGTWGILALVFVFVLVQTGEAEIVVENRSANELPAVSVEYGCKNRTLGLVAPGEARTTTVRNFGSTAVEVRFVDTIGKERKASEYLPRGSEQKMLFTLTPTDIEVAVQQETN